MNNQFPNPELQHIKEFLQEAPPFDALTVAQLDHLLPSLDIIYYRRGHRFSLAEDPKNATGGLRVVRSGAVELRDGNEGLIDRIDQASSFNLLSLQKGHPGIFAIMIEDGLIYSLKETAYQALRQTNRDFDRFFHAQRSRRLRRASRHEPNPNEMMRKVSDIMCREVLNIDSLETIEFCALKMTQHRVSSILIMENNKLLGIVTDRDIRSRAVAKGLDLSLPVTKIMTADPECIEPSSTVFDTTLLMTQHNYHHLPVVEDERVLGIITSSDLMLARQNDPVFLVQHIGRQDDIAGIKSIVDTLPNLVVQWLHSGIRAYQISRILTAISDSVTCRLIELFCLKNGKAPVDFCWLGFGSQARGEQLLNADQDNGLVISDKLQEQDKPWFKALATYVCSGLNTCGYVFCHGKIMAMTDEWRQSLSLWKNKVSSWTRSPTADATMRVSIFFDVRAVWGNSSLADELQTHMLSLAASNSIFLAALAHNALDAQTPLGLFRQFVVERNGDHRHQLDLKKRGLLPIVDLIRLQALANNISAVNTLDRLEALAKGKHMAIVDSRNMQDALRLLMQTRVQLQVEQICDAQPITNYLNPKHLSEISRRQLKDAFGIVADAQSAARLNYRQGMG